MRAESFFGKQKMSKSAQKKKKTTSDNKVQTKKNVHPNSRKVRQMAKQHLHKIKVHQRKTEYANKCSQRIEKFRFFHNCLPTGCNRLSGSEVKLLIDGYFSRFDNEVKKQNEIFAMRRNSNQYAGRSDAIKMTLEKDKQEYQSSAFEIPDLFSTEGFKIFKNWDFTEAYLPKIKTKLVSPIILANYNFNKE